MDPNGLIARLRQRRVFRSAGYYVLGAWVVLQVGDVIVEPAGLPPWSMTALLYALLLGFPLALFLGWRYDITEHGIVRTREGTDHPVDPESLRLKAADYAMIAGLLAVLGIAAWQLAPVARDAGHPASESATVAPAAAYPPGSIAVLPFANLSTDNAQRFLAHGISDTVMHVLAQVEGLAVTARTSSFAFEDSNLGIPEIAEELQVQHVLEGSVQRADDQVRIIARLINTQTGTEVWSGYYDRAVSSVFDIQDEIAQEVTTALTVKVLNQEEVAVTPGYQPDLAAFEEVVLGRDALEKATVDDFAEAYERFQRAVEIDPDYALAYVLLAEALPANARTLGLERSEWIALADEYISRALDLDPLLPEGHVFQSTALLARKQFSEAEQSARRALEISPSLASAYHALRNVYQVREAYDEALTYARKAVELDPEKNQYRLGLARSLWDVGRSEAATATVKEAIRRNPDNISNYLFLARWLRQTGHSGEALYWDKVALDMDPKAPNLRFNYCLGLLQLWRVEDATQCTETYLEEFPGDPEATNYIAHLTGNVALGLENGRREVENNPTSWYRRMQLADWLAMAGLAEELVALFRDAFPALFTDPPEVQPMTIWAASNLVRAYQLLGEHDRANALIVAALEHIETQRKLQGTGLSSGIDDVSFLAHRGDLDLAIERLTEAIDRDYQFYSFALIVNPQLAPALLAEPAFQAQVDRLAARMAQEYAWYETNRDAPPHE
jgi:TolB-like protein/Tfp pilus assembly protein PilF